MEKALLEKPLIALTGPLREYRKLLLRLEFVFTWIVLSHDFFINPSQELAIYLIPLTVFGCFAFNDPVVALWIWTCWVAFVCATGPVIPVFLVSSFAGLIADTLLCVIDIHHIQNKAKKIFDEPPGSLVITPETAWGCADGHYGPLNKFTTVVFQDLMKKNAAEICAMELGAERVIFFRCARGFVNKVATSENLPKCREIWIGTMVNDVDDRGAPTGFESYTFMEGAGGTPTPRARVIPYEQFLVECLKNGVKPEFHHFT